jgi:hypothetical protein
VDQKPACQDIQQGAAHCAGGMIDHRGISIFYPAGTIAARRAMARAQKERRVWGASGRTGRKTGDQGVGMARTPGEMGVI